MIQQDTETVEVTIKCLAKGKTIKYVASLNHWLQGKLTFESIAGVQFTDKMVLATVPFDRDHCIYILLPEDVFVKEGETEEEINNFIRLEGGDPEEITVRGRAFVDECFWKQKELRNHRAAAFLKRLMA